jgi:teichuronic acid biosynthesis glycosyltransferase TuaC
MNSNMLKKTKLLIISDRYPHEKDTISSSFVKSQVDFLKRYFEKIYVISLTPFVPKYLSKFPFMNPRWQRDAFASNYKYDNVEVYFAKHITFPFNFSRQKRGDIAIKVVNKIIREYNINFDLIHAHFVYPSGYVGTELKKKHDKPLIITAHGHDIYELPFIDIEWNSKIKRTLSNSNHMITPSRKCSEILMRLDVPAENISVIPNGYDLNLFIKMPIDEARLLLNLPISKKIILSVGNLEPVKGHKYLIESMKKIHEIDSTILCVIVGSGGSKKSLETAIIKNNLSQCIRLVGAIPHNQIPLWMNACDVFILPSLIEGNPTVMFEALGCGKPFVGTNVGGIPEIIINEKLGILVKPKDIDGLAKAILMGLSTRWDSMYIIEYTSFFTWEKIAARIRDVYEIALKSI